MANKTYRTGIVISGDASGAVKASQLTGKELDALNRKGRQVSSQLSDIAAKGAKWGAVAAGAAAAGAAVLVKQQMSLIDNTAKTSDKLGIATEKLTAMRVQAELTGVAQGTLDKGLQQMIKGVADAAEGTGVAADSLAKLNLNAEQLKNLSPDQQFYAIADAMEEVENNTDKVSIAYDLFGAKGTALINTLKGGSAAALEAQKFTDQWGLAINRVDSSKIEQANDAMTLLGEASQGFWRQLTVNVSPAITGMAKEMLGVGEGFGTAEELADKAFKAIITGAGFVGDMGRGLQIIWKGATMVVAEWFASVWEAIAGADRLITDLLNKLPTSMGGGTFETSDFLQNVSGALRSTADTMKTELSELVNGALPSDLLKAKIQAWEDAATAAGKQVAEGAKVVTGDYEAAAGAAEQLTAAEKKRRDEAEKLAATKAELLGGAEYEVALLSRELTATYAGADALAAFNREKAIEAALRNESAQNLLPAELEKYTAMIGAQYDLAIAIEKKTEADKAAAEAAKESAGAMDKFLNASFGDGLADGFNQGSKALASFIDGFGELLDVQAQYNAAQLDAAATDADKANASAKYQSAQIGLYGDMAAASKQFFDEGSKGYKALQKAEQVFRAFEIGMAAKSLAAKLFATETATTAALASVAPTVAAEGTKAAAAGAAAGASSMVGVPFPANLGALAATLAALAGIGVLIGGGGMSGGFTPRPDSNYDGSQGITASNTVLGDTEAQSESIANSLDLLTDIGDSQLGYTEQMLSSLRNIERSMVGFTAVLAQFPNWSSGAPLAAMVADPNSEYGYRSNARPTIGQVVDGNETAVLEAILKQSMSDQTRSVYEAALPLAALYEQTVADIVGVAREGFIALGKDVYGFDAAVNSLVLPIFNINAGLNAEEQNKQIAAYFSSVGDSIVSVIDPTIKQYQMAGEGALETLARVAGQMFVLRDAAESLGSFMGADGDLIGTAESLSRLAGGVKEFSSNVNDFLDFSLTDAEQFARIGGNVAALFNGLNESLPASREGVADLVRALDLTSDAGQRAFTTLTSASDLLDDYYSKLEDYSKSAYSFDTALGLNDGRKGLRDALAAVGQNLDVVETAAQGGVSALADLLGGLTDVEKAGLEPFTDAILSLIPAAQQAADAVDNTAAILQERLRLENQLLNLQGDTDELRRREREALDESNRALYDQINALQDQAEAAQYAAQAEQALAVEQGRIDQERYNLETQLLQALGDSVVLREREREAINESNRDLYDQIKALEDQQVAAAAAAAAQQAAAQAAEQAQQAMQAAMEQIAQERSSLELQLLQLRGNTAEIRNRERSALDASNHALYDQIKALEDQQAAASAAAAAQKEANQRVSEAEGALKSAFSSESSVLQSSITQFDGIERSLRDFARGFGVVGTGGVNANQLRNQFADVSRRAQLGDVSALESLPAVGAALRDAVASNASSAVELAREYAKIQSASYAAAEVAGRQKSIAELQLDQLTSQVSALIDIKDSVLSVRDAIQNLNVARVPGFASGGSHAGGLRIVGESGPELEFTGPSRIVSNSETRQLLDNSELIREIRELRAENQALRAETKRGLYQIAKNTGRSAQYLDQWDVDGLPEERVL